MGTGGSLLKILDPKGKIVEYYMEMTVQEIEDEFPGYCVSEGVKQFKNPKSDLPSDTVLRMGKTYYLKSKSSRMRTLGYIDGKLGIADGSANTNAITRSSSADSDQLSASSRSWDSCSDCSSSPRSGPMEATLVPHFAGSSPLYPIGETESEVVL